MITNPFGVNTPAPLNRRAIANYTAAVMAAVEFNRGRPDRERFREANWRSRYEQAATK